MRRQQRPLVAPDRFGTLLVFLLAAFLVSGVSDAGWVKFLGAGLNLAALLAGFAAAGLWSDRRRILILVTLVVVGAFLVGSFSEPNWISGVGALAQAFVLLALLLAVTRRVLGHERVEVPTILGAIAGYLIVGLMFAWLYLGVRDFAGEHILEPEEGGLPVYYSFVVLTTLGFGDVTPVNELVKRMTAVEAIAGQIFLATLIARLVSMYGSTPPGRPGSGPPDREVG